MNRALFVALVCIGLVAPYTAAEAKKLQPPGVAAESIPFGEGVEMSGVLAPVDATEIDLRFEQYGGILEVTECAKTGPVEGGDVLLKFSAKWIDKQIAAAKLDMELAKTGFEIAAVGHTAVVDELKLKLDGANRAHRIAKEKLTRFEKVERALRIDESNQGMQRSEDRLADQREELAQLEKMYGEDDLTEETEEIVLKRARRGLQRALRSHEFRKVRQGWFLEQSLPRDHESLVFDVRKHELELGKLTKTLALQQRKRDLEHQKATVALELRAKNLTELQADRALLTVRAPVSGGVAIPGTFAGGKWSGVGEGEYGYEPGDRVKARQTLFTVIDPKRVRVRAIVGQDDRAALEKGMTAFVTCSAAKGIFLPAAIERVADYAAGGKYEVWARLGSGHGALRAGQAVQIGVVKPTAPVHDVLPASCVVKDGDEQYVVVIGDPSGPQKCPVQVVARMAGRVAVTGLAADAHVQLDPPAPKKKKKKKKAKKDDAADEKDADEKDTDKKDDDKKEGL